MNHAFESTGDSGNQDAGCHAKRVVFWAISLLGDSFPQAQSLDMHRATSYTLSLGPVAPMHRVRAFPFSLLLSRSTVPICARGQGAKF